MMNLRPYQKSVLENLILNDFRPINFHFSNKRYFNALVLVREIFMTADFEYKANEYYYIFKAIYNAGDLSKFDKKSLKIYIMKELKGRVNPIFVEQIIEHLGVEEVPNINIKTPTYLIQDDYTGTTKSKQ